MKTIQEGMSLLGQQQHDYLLEMLKEAKKKGYKKGNEEGKAEALMIVQRVIDDRIKEIREMNIAEGQFVISELFTFKIKIKKELLK